MPEDLFNPCKPFPPERPLEVRISVRGLAVQPPGQPFPMAEPGNKPMRVKKNPKRPLGIVRKDAGHFLTPHEWAVFERIGRFHDLSSTPEKPTLV